MIDAVNSMAAVSRARGLDEALKATETTSAFATQAPAGGEADFGVTLASIGGDMVQSLGDAERLSMAGMAGEAGTREVVDAMMEAERTLQTAIAIRDKIVTAYLEISRMTI